VARVVWNRFRPGKPARAARRRAQAPGLSAALWLLVGAAALWLGGWELRLPDIGRTPDAVPGVAIVRTAFPICARPPHADCVIDGDTFYYRRQSIRIADIDAPETHPARCEREARLGTAATHRLRDLLNSGPFEMRSGARDEDRYGRKLRTLVRDGQSVGAVLVSEGLARRWTGSQQPWCGKR
jgi:endonuclease YncB( thermonuclease family)